MENIIDNNNDDDDDDDDGDGFYDINKELLEKNRQEKMAYRELQELEMKSNPHWMRCPKCSGALVEESLSLITVDKCQKCEGIFF
jgi:uncharacterized protein with PIN domain